MIETIREVGIIPFFRSGVSLWSIEERTDPGFWFYSSDELGPWDWKIDVVQSGDIAYGKFLGGKAAFATVEWYRHLMNWRRSVPKYRVALGEKFPAKTRSEKLLKYLSPIALEALRMNGSLEMTELRKLCGGKVTDSQIKSLGAKYRDVLRPEVKKNVMGSVLQFLDMGTWTVTGDFRRVYRGPNLEYTGWQRSSITTPDALFDSPSSPQENQPFWARIMEGLEVNGPDEKGTGEKCTGEKDTEINDFEVKGVTVDCTPEESRQILIDHLATLFPAEREAFCKII